MLDYGWENGNPSPIIISGQDNAQDPNRPVFDPYFSDSHPNFADIANINNPQFPYHQNPNFTGFYDPLLSLEPSGDMVMPKTEPVGGGMDFNSWLGLNLGGRTYFASSSDDFVNRLYRRSRILDPGSVNPPRCQAEGCNADLTHAKHYHRRHKVCEFHSKAATVIAAGLTQRFCQQCSRFHLLSEFDNGKRSCRKRLADHNRRRRKSHQTNQDNNIKNAPNSSSENLARSPPDSSSVKVAVSPPRISLDCLGRRPYSSTASTSSHLYSNE